MLLFVSNLDQLQGQNPEILGGLTIHGLQWESKFLHTLVQHTDSQIHWQFASHTHKSTIKIQGDLYVPVLKHYDSSLENLFCGLQGQRKRSGQSAYWYLLSWLYCLKCTWLQCYTCWLLSSLCWAAAAGAAACEEPEICTGSTHLWQTLPVYTQWESTSNLLQQQNITNSHA